MSVKLNQRDYLKKYLSGDISYHKKKKKKSTTEKYNKRIKIIDDDVDITNNEITDFDELILTGEDAPQIVGIIDDRPPELRAAEDFRSSGKWKSVSQSLNSALIKLNAEDVNDEDKKSSDNFSLKLKNKNLDGNSTLNKKKTYYKVNEDESHERKNSLSSSDDLSPRRRANKESNRKFNDDWSKRKGRDQESIEDINSRRKSIRDRSEDSSPKRRRENRESSEDLYPRRKKKRDHSEDFSPKRKRENREPSEDLDPRRKSTQNRLENFSPKRRRENQEFSKDMDPRRKSKRDRSEDFSPRRRKENRESNEGMDPRRRNKRDHSEDFSPKRKKEKQEFSEDMDLRRSKRDRLEDFSPKRRWENREFSEDLDLRRKSKRDHNEDFSPKRKSYNRNPNNDLNSTKRDQNSEYRRNKQKHSHSPTPLTSRKTLDGKKAGLQDAKALKEESKNFRRREDELFMKMSTDISGKDAEVAIRNSSNKHRNDNAGRNPEEERKKEKLEKEKQEIYNRWSKGLKQIEDFKNKLADEKHEMSKPLARYANDADLDDLLKKQDRVGDPMLEYMRMKKKKNKETTDDEKISKPIYEGSFPENRFNIRPGYRWDGVDRSNGYEKRWFDVQNKKKAIQEEAYRYSTEDM